jgi:hypothetical protein
MLGQLYVTQRQAQAADVRSWHPCAQQQLQLLPHVCILSLLIKHIHTQLLLQVLRVGPDHQYKTIGAAITAAQPNATVLIDAGR